MNKELHIKFRKEKDGPEAELVSDFLKYCDELFNKENLEYSILTEVYAEVGIPDILIVAWDKGFKNNWTPERNNLDKNDIKILHHISSFGKRSVKVFKLSEQLGFSERKIQSSINKLLRADLVSVEDDKVRVCNVDNAFFLRKIISIEAKMKNWKKAFDQARLNENFSSHSYVLFPHDLINENMLANLNGSIGLLGHYGEGAKVKRKARKTKLPGSYFSWILNEYVGRQFATV